MEQSLPPDVDRLIKQLKSPDPIERIRTVQGLADLDCQDEKVRLALENAGWYDLDPFVRSEARTSLERLGFPVRLPGGWVPPEPAETILTAAQAPCISMRSVIIYLIKTTSEELNNYLSQNYPHDPRIDIGEWIDVDNANDPVLYINRMESKSWEESYGELDEGLSAILGEQPTHVVQIDVSGRHKGDKEVQKCVNVLLSRFSGVVQDDYTDHFWTLQEIQSGAQIQGHWFFDYKGWSVPGIIEHSNDRLAIEKEEEERTGAIVLWLMLLPGIGVLVSSLWISLPLWVTILSGGWVFIMLLFTLASIWVPVASLFVVDRMTGELTVQYRNRVFARKIERKKVYPLQDIKDVILVMDESGGYGPSDHIQLVIQRSKYYDYENKRVPIPGSNDYYSLRNEAEVVASFLGLVYKSETEYINSYDY